MTLEFNRTISPNDHMASGNEELYVGTSLSALRCIDAALLAVGKNMDSIRRVLDFGCGYGRVLRVLKAAFPSASVTACDLMPEAVKFCVDTFGAEPLPEREIPGDIEPCAPFDLIWVG